MISFNRSFRPFKSRWSVETKPTDSELLERVRKSDADAFRVLFERYQPSLFRLILFRIRNPDAAHDVVQETFLRTWTHRVSLQPHLPLLPFLLRIGGNLVKDAARHQRIRDRTEHAIPAPARSERDDPEAYLELSTLQEEIAGIINKFLGERCRTVFLLSRFEGKSHREIADLLGVSTRTVENQINHALKVLRRRLGRST